MPEAVAEDTTPAPEVEVMPEAVAAPEAEPNIPAPSHDASEALVDDIADLLLEFVQNIGENQ